CSILPRARRQSWGARGTSKHARRRSVALDPAADAWMAGSCRHHRLSVFKDLALVEQIGHHGQHGCLVRGRGVRRASGPYFKASEYLIRVELRNTISQSHVFGLERLCDLLAVGRVLPAIEELCNERRLLHADLQEVG